MKSVEKSMLVHNYHYKNEPSMAYVSVVTKGFPSLLIER